MTKTHLSASLGYEQFETWTYIHSPRLCNSAWCYSVSVYGPSSHFITNCGNSPSLRLTNANLSLTSSLQHTKFYLLRSFCDRFVRESMASLQLSEKELNLLGSSVFNLQGKLLHYGEFTSSCIFVGLRSPFRYPLPSPDSRLHL